MGDIDFADLQQLGYAGLIEAIDRFDPRRGTPFRAFAAPRISGSIMDGIDRMSEMREQMSWRKRVRRDRVRSLSPPEQDVDGLNEPDALAALADLAVGLALGFMLEGTGLVISDEDAAPNVAIGYESAEWMEVVDHLRAELGDLPRREQLILRHHYGGGVGFDQLAKLLDLSKARISQLHRAALDLLRKRLAARGHFRLER